MNIELKSVKYAAFASEETACFRAVVFIDGVKAGEVSNDGHGGCDMFSPWSLADRLNEYAKTLPAEPLGFKDDGGKPYMHQPDAESLIGRALDAWLMARDFDRAIKRRVLFTKADGKVYQTPTMPPERVRDLLANPQRLKGAVQVLNSLPRDQALAAYAATAAR